VRRAKGVFRQALIHYFSSAPFHPVAGDGREVSIIMNRMAAFLTDHPRSAWALALLVVAVGGVLAGLAVRDRREAEHLALLQIEAERSGVEMMSQTLNGNVMGSLSLLGKVEDAVRQDATGAAPPNQARVALLLEAVGRSHGAEGVFVVGGDGLIHSSWDTSGRPSTGVDVGFRPYFRTAMDGRDNVYAAVSLARGDRALYFATPVLAGPGAGRAVGAVVARTGLERVDALLRDRAGPALLLSPQGVVFASARREWVGTLAGAASPERIGEIRALKQFGTMFDKADPPPLPFAVDSGLFVLEGRRHALAKAKVRWNDPYGDWSLLLLEDLSHTVGTGESVAVGSAAAGILLVLVVLSFAMLRAHHAQALANRRIEAYARAQEAGARRKSQLAEASLRLQRAETIAEVAHAFLAEAHRLVAALQGMVYAYETEGAPTMTLAAAYACAAGLPHAMAAGEGLLGQSVADRRPRMVEAPADGRWLIRSGLGDARPAAVMIAPLLLDHAVLGVAAVAVLNPPDEHAVRQFDEMAALLALNLEIRRRHGAVTIEATP
jgi:C4-dicarboxylate-specific signal transduction histidine kinase